MTLVQVLALAGALAGGAALAGQPDELETRQRTVSGWRIAEVAESDGGRVVRLSREAEGARLQFTAVFWHGNDGRIQSVLVERSDCTNGEELGRHEVPDATALRALFTAALADCALPPRRIAAALAGLKPAYTLAAAWADEAATATAAEAQAIADYGSGNAAADEMTILEGEETVANTAAPEPR